MILRKLIVILLSAVIAGCGSTRTLEKSERAELQRIDLALVSPQSSIDMLVKPSGAESSIAAAGALLGPIGWLAAGAASGTIAHERAENAREFIKPVNDKLVEQGFDFDALAVEKIAGSLAGNNWSHIADTHVTKDSSHRRRDEILYATESDGVLLPHVYYRFSPDFHAIELLMDTYLVQRPSDMPTPDTRVWKNERGHTGYLKITNLGDAKYHGRFRVEIELEEQVGPLRETRKVWMADDARRIRDSLTQGLDYLARMLRYELAITAADLETEGEKTMIHNGHAIFHIRKIELADGTRFIRDRDGILAKELEVKL